MSALGNPKIFGSFRGCEKSIKFNEVSVLAYEDAFRALGAFLINTAYEMEKNDMEHMHLQDLVPNFSYENHVDVIAINRAKVSAKS